ncbi:MAG TPA: AAA family ATPase [Pirellulaceae bacterium]|nr:AAA family ATPase [Pirellulaceae bacterium]
MRITDLQVDGFGVWKGLHVNQLAPDMTVFYGQNEAGKTTLMQFIRTVLFGFAAERRQKYLPPVYGGLAGGTAHIRVPSGVFEVQRHADLHREEDQRGDLTVVDGNTGDIHGNAQLASLMSHIDESIFNNVFAVGLREIQELGALNNTEAAEFLYRLTSGLDRVSLIDVMRDLARRREEVWSTLDEPDAYIQSLLAKRIKLVREIDELRGRTKRWSRIAIQAKDVQHQLDDTANALKRTERDSRLTELAIQIAQRWRQRSAIAINIESLGKLPDPRDVSVAKLDEYNQRIVHQEQRIQHLQNQRAEIKAATKELPLDRNVWVQRTRIEALAAHAPWIQSLQRQSQQVQAEHDQLNQSLQLETDALVAQFKFKSRELPLPTGKPLAALRGAARELSEHQSRLQRLRDESEKAQFELGQHEKHLGGALSDYGDNIPETLDDINRHVNRLRRRIELEEKIDKLQRARSDLEREVDDVVNEQVLPVGKLTVIGIVFVIGVILVGFGLVSTLSNGTFWATSTAVERTGEVVQNVGFVFMLLGAVFGFVSMGLKYHWERTARDELESFRHQMELVRQQLKRARSERDEIDRQLPKQGGHWDVELKDAESRLARLEDLAPLESRAKSARGRLDDLQRRMAAQQRELEQSEQRWKTGLRTAGLPETLTPLQVKEFSQRQHRLAQTRERLQTIQRDLAERTKELDQIARRAAELALDCGLEDESDDPLAALHLLETKLDEQRHAIAQRQTLIEQYRQLRAQLEKAKRDLDRLLTARNKHLASVGVESEEEYRQIDIKHLQRNKLLDQHRQITEQIAAALGNHFRESDVSPLLDAHQQAGLEQMWEELQRDVERLKAEHAKLLQLRGELTQELKSLGEDDRLDVARLELNSLEAELDACLTKWQVLATSSQMLESIRDAYEAKRQPETLKEASQYLERLTDGHYVRIWTRLVGEQLLVDTHDGETITVDRLSRGTREAVYLSLRLALVTAYARRGAVLPLILDDVLVNFDARRARSAAKLLVDFSRNGYQIMMFTCHDHMRDLFHELGVHVLILPHHKEVVEHQARPWLYRVESLPFVASETPKPAASLSPRFELRLNLDTFDPELEYELAAIDQLRVGRAAAPEEPETNRPTMVSPTTVPESEAPDFDEFWPDFPLHRRTA